MYVLVCFLFAIVLQKTGEAWFLPAVAWLLSALAWLLSAFALVLNNKLG